MDLGLGYLALDRAGATLSTGERQRVQLARAVRNRTTGVLYVLDEPSIGLHPSNIDGLLDVARDLGHGNSVVLVDHDARMLRAADSIVEMGPGAGRDGGAVVCQGAVDDVRTNPASLIGPFLGKGAPALVRERTAAARLFDEGTIRLSTAPPAYGACARPGAADMGRLVAVTGVSGSGKTTLVLESLVPALEARLAGEALPSHVRALDAEDVTKARLIDATPIGVERPFHRGHLLERATTTCAGSSPADPGGAKELRS